MSVTGISPALRGAASAVTRRIETKATSVITELAQGVETKATLAPSNSEVTAALKALLGIKSPIPKVTTAEKTPGWKTPLVQGSERLSSEKLPRIYMKPINLPEYESTNLPDHKQPDELLGYQGEEQATTLYKAPRILTKEEVEANSQKSGSQEAGSDESHSCTDPNGECCHDFCCVSKHNPKRFTDKMNKFDRNCCSG